MLHTDPKYQELIDDNVALVEQHQKLREWLEAAKREIERLKHIEKSRDEERHRMKQLERSAGLLRESAEESKREKEALKEELASFQAGIETLKSEKRQLLQTIGHLQQFLSDKETQWKVVQKHLARKVKEVAILENEKDELHKQAISYQNQTKAHQIAYEELKKQVDQKKSLIQEIDDLKKKNSEVFQVLEEANKTICELKLVEEKYQQLQALLK